MEKYRLFISSREFLRVGWAVYLRALNSEDGYAAYSGSWYSVGDDKESRFVWNDKSSADPVIEAYIGLSFVGGWP